MNQQFKRLFFGLALATLLGCAPTPQKESLGEFVDDAAITAKVKAAILDDPALKVNEISVETFKGVVQLSGFVSSPASIDRAIAVTRNVRGVKSVSNAMSVK